STDILIFPMSNYAAIYTLELTTSLFSTPVIPYWKTGFVHRDKTVGIDNNIGIGAAASAWFNGGIVNHQRILNSCHLVHTQIMARIPLGTGMNGDNLLGIK